MVVNKKVYLAYLKSNKWFQKRQHIASLKNYTCEKCKKVVKSGFHIHHKTYKHLTNEKDNELMFLCETCHKRLHQNKNINKYKKSTKKTFTCKFCLNKISLKKYMDNYLTHCPYCSSYIGRPSYYKSKL